MKVLEQINSRLLRIEYALIPPEKVSKEEAEELNKLFKEALESSMEWRERKEIYVLKIEKRGKVYKTL